MKLSEIKKIINFQIDENRFEPELNINKLNTLKDGKSGELSFLENKLYVEDLKNSKVSAVLISPENLELVPQNIIPLITKKPYIELAKLSKYFVKEPFDCTKKAKVDKKAKVHSSVTIGSNSIVQEGTYIMPGVVIGSNVKIGKNVKIYPNVVIYDDTIIKDNCILQAGVIVGSDGFGYAHTQTGEHIKIHHSGNVVLEEDVELGANVTVDRAVFGSTIVGKNTKIDNLVQIAHNCELGESCIMVSQSGLAGSTTLGRNVIMGGQSATAGHLKIGDFAVVAGRGGVNKSIEGGKTYGGFPLMLQKDWLKVQLRMIKYFSKKHR